MDLPLVTVAQLIKADMHDAIRLDKPLKDRLTVAVNRAEAGQDKNEYDPEVGKSLAAVAPDKQLLTAKMLVQAEIGGTLDLDIPLRRLAGEVLRATDPAKSVVRSPAGV